MEAPSLLFQLHKVDCEPNSNVVRLYGRTRKGEAVFVKVTDFYPYFHVPYTYSNDVSPNEIRLPEIKKEFQDHLAKRTEWLVRDRKSKMSERDLEVTSVRFDYCRDGYYFHPEGMGVVRVSLENPNHLMPAANVFSRSAYPFKFGPRKSLCIQPETLTYGANTEYEIRFCSDRNIVPGCWLRIENAESPYRLICSTKDLKRLPKEEEMKMVPAPHVQVCRTLGFRSCIDSQFKLTIDFEMLHRDGSFCDAENREDRIVLAAGHLRRTDQPFPMWYHFAFLLRRYPTEPMLSSSMLEFPCDDGTEKGARVNVFEFATERELITALLKFILEWDPDQIVTYNGLGFDIKYLLERCKLLGIPTYFGKTGNQEEVTIKKAGKIGMEIEDITIAGRSNIDLLVLIKTDVTKKYRSYKLDAVCHELFGEKVSGKLKEGGISGEDVPVFWNSSNENDHLLLVRYCWRDAYLTGCVLDKCGYHSLLVYTSYYTGVSDDLLIKKGQAVRCMSMLYQDGARQEIPLIYPVLKMENQEQQGKFEGARVLEAIRGFYDDWIVLTLDYEGLYPSDIIAYNLGHDTMVATRLVLDMLIRNGVLKHDDVQIAPDVGTIFVKKHIRESAGSRLESALKSLRGMFKRMMAECKKNGDAEGASRYDAAQNAVKVLMNSFYGFFGLTHGKLPNPEVGKTVTAYGRQALDVAKTTADEFRGPGRVATVTRVHSDGTREETGVVYGDTDSVFVLTECKTLEEARKLGMEIVAAINKKVPPPMNIQLEKFCTKLLLQKKKRYAYEKWLIAGEGIKSMGVCSSGLENKRRDNFPLMSNTIDRYCQYLCTTGDRQGALQLFKNAITSLLKNEVPVEDLIIVQEIKKKLDKYDGEPVHVAVARKMVARANGLKIPIGTRIRYVLTASGSNKKSTGAEDVEYAKSQGLPIDTEAYLNKLKKPFCKLAGFVLKKGDRPLDPKKEEDYKHIEDYLFSGSHTLVRVHAPVSKTHGIGRFFKVAEKK